MSIGAALGKLLEDPSPESLWELRSEILAEGAMGDDPSLEVIDTYYHYLNHLGAGGRSRELSHLASKLDVLAVGTVALENVLGDYEGGDLAKRLALAAISEGLMVLASRQYVRAAEVDMAAVDADMAWYLFDAYWRLSRERQPEQAPQQRRQGLEVMLAPLRSDETEPAARVVMIALLAEVLIVVRLENWLRNGDLDASAHS